MNTGFLVAEVILEKSIYQILPFNSVVRFVEGRSSSIYLGNVDDE